MRKPLAFEAYETLAEAYSAHVDTKPHNAYYERPATLSLLPDVAGLTVLDAGCGPGSYTQWLVRHGARVVAIDASPRMIELAKSRVSAGVDYHVADLEGNLPFLSDGSFDLVIAPLVMDYLRDWQEVFMKFNRLLKPGGWLVFSSGHPMFDAKYYNTADYFATELVRCTWKGFGVPVEMPSYRRSLSSAINPLLESGFEIVQILEPKPTEHFQRADPVKYKRLMCEPCFLCIKARKAA